MKLKEFFGLKNQNQKKKQKKRPLTSEAVKGTSLLDDMASLSIIEMCDDGAGGGGGGGPAEEAAPSVHSSKGDGQEDAIAKQRAREAGMGWSFFDGWHLAPGADPYIKKGEAEEKARAKAAARSASKLADREVHTAGIEAVKAADKADRLMEREVQSARRGIARDERKTNPSTHPPKHPPKSSPPDEGSSIMLPHMPQANHHTLPPGLSAAAAVREVRCGRNPMKVKSLEKSSDKSKAPQHQKTSDKKAEQTVGGNNMHQIGKNTTKNQTMGKGQLQRKSQIIHTIHTDKDKSY